MKHTNILILNDEFKSLKNEWKDMYQWKRITSKGNIEIIAEMINKNFSKCQWSEDGLRYNSFKIIDHKGYCALNTTIKQFTEKRFCRALYNKYCSYSHDELGLILDYEVPLTKPKQGEDKVNHGDIDLIAKRNNELLLIEVKKSKSTESILKAVLEIFVYTYRLVKFDRINQLKQEYGISDKDLIVPCVLVFNDSKSGEQLLELKTNYPKFYSLLDKINIKLAELGIKNIEFYIVDRPNCNYEVCLKVTSIENSKHSKIELSKEPVIKKHTL